MSRRPGGESSRRVRWRAPLLALLLGAAVAATLGWSGELALRVLRPDPGIAARREAEAIGMPFDLRSRDEVVADLRAQGTPAVPRLAPARMLDEGAGGVYRSRVEVDGVELLPLAGISNATTVFCNETGRYVIYRSDRHGFRNAPELWSAAPLDLMLVGDSFTIGACVAQGETIADGLRRDWPATLNLGYSGNSPLMELATLVEFGPALEPRVTLWIYFENDLSPFDLGQSARSPLLMRYLEPGFSQSLIARQPAIDLLLTELVESRIAESAESAAGAKGDPSARAEHAARRRGVRWMDFLAMKRTRRVLGRLLGGLRPPDPRLNYPLLEAILRRARDEAASWKGEVVVVGLPGVWNFDSQSAMPRWTNREALDRVRERAESLGLRFVDVRRAMEGHADPLSLYSFRGESAVGSPHMNAAGYAFTVQVVRDHLRDPTRRVGIAGD